MGNALTVANARLPGRLEESLRAAQYIRMSTERQQYSIPNQMAAIALYAAERGLTIVRTYVDEATSGLRLSNRPGLIGLLNDVQSGSVDFANVLVFDVSRWGRFQDTDESAHYEFICKHAGVKVSYCAEVFENDGSPLSGIFKNLKRLMAAEYSRELSAKVFAGQSRVAGLGFWVGGEPGFALRRELVDAKGNSKGQLQRGHQKAIQSDRVLLRPGPAAEVAIVRWIFQSFVVDRKNETRIARELNAGGIRNHRGTTWSLQMIGRILRNEAYIGYTVYNRTSNRLRQRRVNNGRGKWIRGENAIEPIVPREIFDRAQKIFEKRLQRFTSDDLLKKLRVLQMRQGQLSRTIIDQAKSTPKAYVYERRFGSLRAAYALIGYVPKVDFTYIDARAARNDFIKQLASEIAASVPQVDPSLIPERAGGCLAVKNGSFISLRVSRCWQHPQRNCPAWTLRRGARPRPGLVVIARMDEQNRQPLEFILELMSCLPKRPLIVTEPVLAKRYPRRFKGTADLIQALKRMPLGRARRTFL
ncbi:recombinase family protein [Bradyrhizobium liaoningense]|uniref:recombinase family protein n=1 Tax=Bradyrhizobium liaoningense TaxID=43992 RepID=UPI001BA9CCC8|nr:recombinase family protein [Bradyrhizobium liaoningense]MBR0855689.1 recombinase family protein [Bradyrhizobium liaoningense]